MDSISQSNRKVPLFDLAFLQRIAPGPESVALISGLFQLASEKLFLTRKHFLGEPMNDRAEQFEPAGIMDSSSANWDRPSLSDKEMRLLSHNQNTSPMADYCLPVVNFVKEHPVAAISAAAGLAVGWRLLSRTAEKTLASVVEATACNSELRTAAGLACDTATAAASIERSFLKDLSGGAAITAKSREGYAADLLRAASLPKSSVGLADETITGFAERQLRSRAAITGEQISSESIATEAGRITKLNTTVFSEVAGTVEMDLGGRNLTTMSRRSFANLAQEMQSRHVPPIEEFLKATGRISEEQISSGLRFQHCIAKGSAKLEEVLIDQGLASKTDVELAIASRSELKSVLRSLREKFLAIEDAHALKIKPSHNL